jgi:hypothetical protein
MLHNLSNVVTASASERLLVVGSCGRARGLLQKPALPPASTLEPEGLEHSCLLWLAAGLMEHVLECFR